MTAAVAMNTLVSVTTTILPAPSTSDYLGLPVILTADTLEGGGAGSYMAFSSAAQVATALAATQISSTTATNLDAALAQSKHAAAIYVVTYAAGAPSAALQLFIEAGKDLGLFMLQDVDEADQETLAVWLQADSQRKVRYAFIVQTADTAVYGGSKPASLSDCEWWAIRVIYSADAQPTAAAYLGFLSGQKLQGVNGGPIGSRVRLLSVASSGLTDAQVTTLFANDACTALKMDYGSGATEVVLQGVTAYDGTSWKVAVSLIYTARQIRAGLRDFWLAQAILGNDVPGDDRGCAMIRAAVDARVSAINAAGHYTVSEDYPGGYRIDVSVSSNVFNVDVYTDLAQEPVSVAVTIYGQEV